MLRTRLSDQVIHSGKAAIRQEKWVSFPASVSLPLDQSTSLANGFILWLSSSHFEEEHGSDGDGTV